jgi:FdhD protein
LTSRSPTLSDAGKRATCNAAAVNEFQDRIDRQIAGEFPLTIYLDKREVVTLMTMGTHPEALTLGYLKNQWLIERIEDIKSVQVDWETESVAVVSRRDPAEWSAKLDRRTVTTGCGQGASFGNIVDELAGLRLLPTTLKQSTVYSLLRNLVQYNEVYKNAGAVHGCALCRDDQILMFIEDVGRHNAVDAIAGLMWLDGISGEDKLFYTTGRLTSEMVIKVAQMNIPVLLSRSGVTQMGLELAQQLGVLMIARAKGRHFLIYNGADRFEFDAPPRRPPAAPEHASAED